MRPAQRKGAYRPIYHSQSIQVFRSAVIRHTEAFVDLSVGLITVMIAKSEAALYSWQTNTATSPVNGYACQVSRRMDSPALESRFGGTWRPNDGVPNNKNGSNSKGARPLQTILLFTNGFQIREERATQAD